MEHAPNVVAEEEIGHGRGEHVREHLQPPEISTAASSVATTATTPGARIKTCREERTLISSTISASRHKQARRPPHLSLSPAPAARRTEAACSRPPRGAVARARGAAAGRGARRRPGPPPDARGGTTRAAPAARGRRARSAAPRRRQGAAASRKGRKGRFVEQVAGGRARAQRERGE